MSQDNGTPASGIDKNALYGDFRSTMKARERLAMRVAHKAVDIPEDDMEINAPKTTTITHNGVGIWGILGIVFAVLLALALGALAAWFFLKPSAPAKPDAYDQITEELQPDGSWKIVDRSPWKR